MEIVGYKFFVKRIYVISLLGTLGLFAQSPRFSFSVDSISVNVESTLSSETSLTVYLGKLASRASQKPILGKTTITEKRIAFYPWVPLQRDVVYTLVWDGKTKNFSISQEEEYSVLQVKAVHPSSDSVPSNLLKWYIQFSRPVNPSKIYDHITLIDASGKVVERAILPLETPLLSEDGKTLTMWMEPGRQKRHLGPNDRLGEVMRPNSPYTLRISQKLRDKNGLFLERAHEHHFQTEAPDRKSPDTKQWLLQLPKSGTKEGLRLIFKETLDYGSLHESFAIVTPKGEAIDGNFNYEDTEVHFYPVLPWTAGTYVLRFNKRIEDVAGNNLERPFDRDIAIPLRTPNLERTFTIGH